MAAAAGGRVPTWITGEGRPEMSWRERESGSREKDRLKGEDGSGEHRRGRRWPTMIRRGAAAGEIGESQTEEGEATESEGISFVSPISTLMARH